MKTTTDPQVAAAREIVDLVFRLVGRMHDHFETTAGAFGLPVTDAKALLRLGGGIPMRELALELRCDASNVTGIADRLEARGLARRELHPSDRRVRRLVATDDGRRLVEAFSAKLYEEVPILTSLPASDRRAFRDLLRRALGP
jgi:DNA-binding MarR family transcriptional regulator